MRIRHCLPLNSCFVWSQGLANAASGGLTGFKLTEIRMGNQRLFQFDGFALGPEAELIADFAKAHGMGLVNRRQEEGCLEAQLYTTDVAVSVYFKLRWGGMQ